MPRLLFDHGTLDSAPGGAGSWPTHRFFMGGGLCPSSWL